LGEEALSDPRLEEIEPSDDGAYRYITVSFFRDNPLAAFAATMGVCLEGREFKTLAVDANNGTVKSMKIRQLT
jgi:hypothetical protein